MQSCWKRSRKLTLIALVAAVSLAAQLRPQPWTEASRQSFLRQFAAAALERTQHAVRYDPAYIHLAYPGGDVPAGTGVCTDEVIRSYRAIGIDLQKEVHEDMVADFTAYPRKWGRQEPDPNIDHRRVPNLMVFFSRKGENLAISSRAEDYALGDLVTWDLGRGLTHIGMVVDRKAIFTRRYMIVHNIGAGPKMEDVIFDWKVTGHYRYFGSMSNRRDRVIGKQNLTTESS
jgi:uncharacterized protein YijF (DUF1287 family)